MLKWIFSVLCSAGIGPCVSANPIATTKNDKAAFDQWAKIKLPMPGPATPIGFYSAGCLLGASTLPLEGNGYAVMRPARNRYYAHPEMISYLQALSDRLHAAGLPLLLIGDVGPPRGGPMLSGHASHQMGLDADLWLTMSAVTPSDADRENWPAPGFVINRKKLRKSWGNTQANLIATAADSPVVNRIFVSPPIKRYFCQHYAGSPWLYKIRPWWGHEEHLHVRLNCPPNSPTCVPQAALNPTDPDCGTGLDWWFSKAADDEWQKMISHPTERQFPDLPAQCAQLLT